MLLLHVIVDIRIMPQIPQQTAQVARKHALQSLERGKSLEELGKRLQSNDPLKEEIGQSIEESGKTIQEQAQKFGEKTQQLAESGSTEVFAECLQAHIDVNQTYIEAVKEFQKELQTHLTYSQR